LILLWLVSLAELRCFLCFIAVSFHIHIRRGWRCPDPGRERRGAVWCCDRQSDVGFDVMRRRLVPECSENVGGYFKVCLSFPFFLVIFFCLCAFYL
jgi:hypothetical protein